MPLLFTRRAMLPALFLLAAAHAARAQTAAPIDTVDGLIAAGYNTYVESDLGSAQSAYTSDSQGAIAAGGNAYLTNFGASTNSTANGVGLAVGGNVSVTYGSVNGAISAGGNVSGLSAGFNNVSAGGNVNYTYGQINGSVSAAGSVALNGAGVSGPIAAGGGGTYNGQTVQASPVSYTAPVNFAAVNADLTKISTSLATAQITAGDTLAQTGGGFVFTATQAGQNVFDVTAAQFAAMKGSQVTFASTVAGATDVINVADSGTVALPGNMSFAYSGTMSDNKVLLNLANASTVTAGTGVSEDISIMAPNATFIGNSGGNLTGALFVQNLTGGEQLNTAQGGAISTAMFATPNAPAGIAPAPVPLPGSSPVALLLLGWFRRRQIRAIAARMRGTAAINN